MNYTHLYALLLLFVFYTSYAQTQTTALNVSNDTVTTYGPKTMVRNVKQGKNGTVLIAASFSGVLRYDGKKFTNLTRQLGPRRFWDVLEDRQGDLWMATSDSGVYHYNGKFFQHLTTKEGLAGNGVFCIYEDRAGHIWFGTGGGASCYDGKTFINFTTQNGLPNNSIHTIIEDKAGRLWLGTGGDACYYEGKTFTVFKNKEGKPFYNVWSIIEDNQGNIWFGASIIEDRKGNVLSLSNGLWRYDGSTFTKVSEGGAAAIIQDKSGNLWKTSAVNPNGVGAWILSRYDQRTLYSKRPIVTQIASINTMLCGILEASDGSIWFGSLSGVYRYDGKTITDFKKIN